MVKRKRYFEPLRPFISKPLIKVITGVRRCGKSTFLQQIIEHLKEKGVAESQIVFINKELFEFDGIRTYADLHKYVSKKSKGTKGMLFLFVDEIQEIEQWEKAIASFLAEKKYDIYITGSNAHLLSSELSTLLTGRYVEFKMYPLSFSEFTELMVNPAINYSTNEAFDLYVKFGGFPGIHLLDWEETAIRQYLQSLYSTILLKDIVIKNSVRDAEMLEKVLQYIISNVGNITSANRISAFVKSQNRKVSVETIQNYLNYACSALLMNKVRRYDIRGKRLLESHDKYFLVDQGFSFSTIGYLNDYLPGILENIVLQELLSRGYNVNIGKLPDSEIDFMAEKNKERIYIQVCTTLKDEKTSRREYKSLQSVPDHYTKLVLSLDRGFDTSLKGIRWKNITDFLLEYRNI